MTSATVTRVVQRSFRLELVTAALITLLGAGLRVAYPERMAVEHFDEGVYAANWFCRPPGLPEGIYPRQYLYAPPLLPELCFWTLFAAGGDPHAVIWINVVAGSLMIPLLWWIGRGWFGPAAGLTAAALCAFSDVHLAFSRMVLTDVLLCLFLTAGVGMGVRAIQTGRPLTIALAGLLAGLAWWTKYNGWLTLAITGAGLAGWLVFVRPRGVSWTLFSLRWLTTAAIACAVWSPVLWNLQSVGGYSVVAANHARYFVGLAGWVSALGEQVRNLASLDGRLGIVLTSISFAAGAGAAWKRFVPNATTAEACTRGLLAGSLLAMGSLVPTGTATAFVLIGLVVLIRRLRTSHTTPPDDDPLALTRDLPAWTALAWMLGLFVAVPLYTPYPRLALPLVGGSWLALSSLLDPCALQRRATVRAPQKTMSAAAAICVIVAMGQILWWTPSTPHMMTGWEDRRGLASLAGPIAGAAAVDFAAAPAAGVGPVQAALYVFAEPALFYHLSAQSQSPGFRYLVQPIGDHALLEQGPPESALATYIITGPHADAAAADAERFSTAAAAGQVRLVEQWPYRPSELVLLDRLRPADRPATTQSAIRLYRVTPPGRSGD